MLANYVAILVWVSEKIQITVWTASSDTLLLMSSNDYGLIMTYTVDKFLHMWVERWDVESCDCGVFISQVSITLPTLIVMEVTGDLSALYRGLID